MSESPGGEWIVIDPAPVQALSALFDTGPPAPEPGDALPPLWHWVALARWAPSSTLGPDGHPQSNLPPELNGKRRMFAGGRVDLYEPLRVGARVRRENMVLRMEPKNGRRGPFVLVEEQTLVLTEDGNVAVDERRDLVYREAVPRSRPPDRRSSAPTPSAPGPVLVRQASGWVLRTDASALMRFSAATANAHRIHYDRPYATQVEGYPDIVVQGPLMTLALAEALRLDGHFDGVRSFRHRNSSPLFCGQEAGIDFVTPAVEGGDGPGRGWHVRALLRSGDVTHSSLDLEVTTARR